MANYPKVCSRPDSALQRIHLQGAAWQVGLIAFLALGQAFILSAPDARNVIEPFFPQLCTTLDAQLQASGRSLAPADEQKLDTARIQRAIDKCGKGRAVLLHVNEVNNAFLGVRGVAP